MKKGIILLILAVIIIGGAIGGYFYTVSAKEVAFLSSDPRTKDAYASIVAREERIKANSEDYDAYMTMAFNWKGIGEVLENEKYSRRAVSVYTKVIRKWGVRAYLPFLNRANVYMWLKEYNRAEDDFKVAIDIDPGEQNLYIALAELYRNYLKKDDKTIRDVYVRGIKTVVNGSNLVLSYAAYLRDTGDYKEALKYYRSLSQAFPENQGYKDMISEVELMTK